MGDLRKVTIIAVLGMFILGAVFSFGLLGCKKEDKIMDVTSDGDIPNTVIPALDRQAPNRTETATFALG